MYHQIFPRDLFNQAKLLKCLGQLILKLENSHLKIDFKDNLTDSINIEQDYSDGSIFASNVPFTLHSNGNSLKFYTPYNTKEAYPLMLLWNDDEIEVLNNGGNFSNDFLIWYDKITN